MRAGQLRGGLFVVAGVIVWLAWISWPVPVSTNFDASWQLVTGYAHVHGWKFGRDFVFTHGPGHT